MSDKEVTLADVFKAKNKIYSVVDQTPLISTPDLSAEAETNVYYKLENMQDTGSFKVRGAANLILNLDHKQREKGVVTYSTGNHGRATAHVAKSVGSRAKVCLSNNVPKNKREGVRKSGGELVVYGDSQDEATERARELVKEEGLAMVPPFDDPHIVAGQGTIGLEIMEQLPEVDTVLVPLSGGGLAAGIGLAVKSIAPDCKVYGISMEEGAAMYQSLKAGKPVQVEETDTLADSLQGGILLDNQYTFHLVKKYLDDVILVSEEEIGEAIAYAFLKDNIVLEGASAVGIAALREKKLPSVGEKVVTIVSGRNIDNQVLLSLVEDYRDQIK